MQEQENKKRKCYAQGCENEALPDESFCSEECRTKTFGEAKAENLLSSDLKIKILQDHFKKRAKELIHERRQKHVEDNPDELAFFT